MCDQNHRAERVGSLTSRLGLRWYSGWERGLMWSRGQETVSVARREIRTGLDALFLPDSVAVVGATERTGTVGRTILENMLHASFRCKAFAVNYRPPET